jgi:glycosyltransferase involved in cell wall biosynthesis
MKVLYSCLSKSWGGMEMYTLTSIRQLLKKNIQVELLCIAESRIHIEANSTGIIIHPVKASGYFHPFIILKIIALIKQNKYNIIHTQASKDLWLLVPALKTIKSRIPLILTKQVGSFIIKKDYFHRWIYTRLTFALAISSVIKKNLLNTCPLEEEKVLLLHNGIDLNVFDPQHVSGDKIRNQFDLKENDFIIGMMARFSPGKGHEEFLKAGEILNKKYSHLKFLVVGEASHGEDEYMKKIKNKAARLNLNNVIFTGFRSDTPEVLSAMDIFVFPSHAEAFGIALVEAMAMGKPSVCTNSDGILDIAVDGITSYLFQNKNPFDLAAKIELLINSSEKRKIFGQEARKRAAEKFNIEKLTEKVIEIYRKAIEEE